MTSGKASYSFTADEKPDKAGIDPLLLLIDRVPDDNMTEVTIQPRTGSRLKLWVPSSRVRCEKWGPTTLPANQESKTRASFCMEKIIASGWAPPFEKPEREGALRWKMSTPLKRTRHLIPIHDPTISLNSIAREDYDRRTICHERAVRTLLKNG